MANIQKTNIQDLSMFMTIIEKRKINTIKKRKYLQSPGEKLHRLCGAFEYLACSLLVCEICRLEITHNLFFFTDVWN